MRNNHRLTRTIVSVILVAFILLAILALIMLMEKATRDVSWDKGKINASERGYFTDRVKKIVGNWRKNLKDHGYTRDGCAKEPYDTYLVIDTLKPAMWLESNGKILKHNYTDLPANMYWKHYRTGPAGNQGLPPVIRLKMRGMWTGQEYSEMICVQSYGRADDSLSFYFTSGKVQTEYGKSGYKIQKWKSKNYQRRRKEDFYKSIIVSDAEWQTYQQKFASTAEQPMETVPADGDAEAAWYDIERELYQRIEEEVIMQGYNLWKMWLDVGPVFTAAKGKIILRYEGGTNSSKRTSHLHDLNIVRTSLIGKDLWYVQSFPDIKFH